MNLFIEIGVENFPSALLQQKLEELESLFYTKSKIRVKAQGTHRRLVLIARNFSFTESLVIGPPYEKSYSNGTLNSLGKSFLDSRNLIEPIIHIDSGKKYLAGKRSISGIYDLISSSLKYSIQKIKFDKSMEWNGITFIRPIRYITSFVDSRCLDIEIGNLRSSNYVIVSNGIKEITSFQEYFDVLKENDILISQEDRIERVKEIEKTETFMEIINSVESPKSVICNFSQKYRGLPYEIIKKCIEIDQKGIMRDSSSFYVIAEKKSDDFLIKRGNENVVESRLADASLFVQKDLRREIPDFVRELKDVVQGLGTMLDKQLRLTKLAEKYMKIYSLDRDVIEVAKISKFDLASHTVKDKRYTDLKGYIGKYLLDNMGIKINSQLIFDQYLPRFSGDKLPSSFGGAIMSILDKADNIVSAATMKNLPTGAKDPLFLRRDAISIITLIDKFKIDLDLEALFENISKEHDQPLDLEELEIFFKSRLFNYLSKEYSKNLVNSVIDRSKNVLDIINRLDILSQVDLHELKDLYLRVTNIVRDSVSDNIKEDLFEFDEERTILGKIREINGIRKEDEVEKDKKTVLSILSLKEPLESFFNRVMVMVDDKKIRDNRLSLMYNLVRVMNSIADLDKIFKG